MQQKANFLWFILLFTILGNPFKVSAGHDSPMMFDLIHRDAALGLPHHERLKQMLARDKIRMQRKLTSLDKNNNEAGSPAVMPLVAGAYFGIGEYVVKLQVESQTVKLVLDTGSDFMWLNKSVCKSESVTSFKPVNCSSSRCPSNIEQVFGNLASCDPSGQCVYDYSYSSGNVSGDFVTANVTFNRFNGLTKQISDIQMGCTHDMRGLEDKIKGTDGILGISYSSLSLPQQTNGMFGPTRFSYCLVDHLSSVNVTSKFILGPSPQGFMPESSQSTKLIQIYPFFLGVKVEYLTINGTKVNEIPKNIWKYNDIYNQWGTIMDSGTTYTVLASSAYTHVTEYLNAYLSGLAPVNQTLLNTWPFKFCYNTTVRNVEETLPAFEFAFEDGANFTVPPQNYFFPVADNVKCLNFVDGGEYATNVIGNIMQQNHVLEFNLHSNTLSFARSNCTS